MEHAEITNSDLEQIRSLIYKETGMLFSVSKNYFLESRIRARMGLKGFERFAPYYYELTLNQMSKELKEFIEAITINETYFFRDFPQLQGFADEVLPVYTKEREKLSNDLQLNIWSAACSTGEEPYTLSIILKEMLPKGWKFKLDATDIDTKVLAAAKAGVYGDRSLKEVPTDYRKKYFKSEGDKHQVSAALQASIQFKQLNFVDRAGMRAMKGYDFIFCRNVLIYFDDDSRKKVVNSLFDSLNPGGFLFLGHSESVGRMTAAFQLQKIGDFLCYRKPYEKK